MKERTFKRALITGITGMVGPEMARLLIKEGIEVFGIKRWRSSLENIKDIKDKITLYDGDFRDTIAMENIMADVQPDVIFHIGAQSYVPYSFQNPTDTLMTNVIGTVNILEAASHTANCDPVIIMVASSEVYGIAENFPTKEDEPMRPMSPYAVSKCTQNLLAYQYHQSYGMKIITTRAFNHFSKHRAEVFVESAFAKQIAMIEAGKQDPVIKVGNLQSNRCFHDCRDICNAYYLLAKKGRFGESYNIGGQDEITIKQLLDKLLSLSPMKDKIGVKVDPRLLRPSDVTKQIPDCTKLERDCPDWKIQYKVEDTLKELLDYWREKVKQE